MIGRDRLANLIRCALHSTAKPADQGSLEGLFAKLSSVESGKKAFFSQVDTYVPGVFVASAMRQMGLVLE